MNKFLFLFFLLSLSVNFTDIFYNLYAKKFELFIFFPFIVCFMAINKEKKRKKRTKEEGEVGAEGIACRKGQYR